MQFTHTLASVAVALMSRPQDRHWGYELSKETNIRSGALYPILGRLLAEGWIDDGWEDQATITEKRPPRRYYTITEAGIIELGALAQRASRELPAHRFRPGPATA